MSGVQIVRIPVEINYAPDGDGEEFAAWCEMHGFDRLSGGRRAWCSEFSSYLRDALGVATTGCGERFLIYPEDLEAPR